MAANRTATQTGLLLLIAGSAVDSTSGLWSRLLNTDAFTISAGRGLIAFACMMAIVVWKRGSGAVVALLQPGWAGVGFAVANACGMVFNMLSLANGPVANFFMIFAVAPFAAAMVGWLVLKERFDGATLLAAAAGFIGVAVMMYAGARTTGLIGNLFALGCVGTYSCLILLVRGNYRMDLLPTLCLTLLLSAVIGLPFSHLAALDGRGWLLMSVFGIFQLALGNILIFNAVSRIPAAQGGLLGILNAAFAPLWVLVFLGEVPPLATLIGGGIILGAAIVHLAWLISRAAASGQTR